MRGFLFCANPRVRYKGCNNFKKGFVMGLFDKFARKTAGVADTDVTVRSTPNLKWLRWGAIAIGLIWLILWGNPIATVPSGHRGVVTTFGKVMQEELSEGIHLVRPFIDKVKLMNVQVQKIETKADAGTQDLQRVDTTIAVNGHIEPTEAAWVYQNVGSADSLAAKVVSPAIEEVTKAVTARYSAEQLLSERQKVSSEIREQLAIRLKRYGVVVDDFSITNFQFSPSYQKAIDDKVVVAQQQLTMERERDKAKIEAEKIVAEAEGKKQAKIKLAEAEAEAIKIQREALKASPEIIELRKIEAQMEWIKRWDGKQPQVVSGSGTGMLMQMPDLKR